MFVSRAMQWRVRSLWVKEAKPTASSAAELAKLPQNLCACVSSLVGLLACCMKVDESSTTGRCRTILVRYVRHSNAAALCRQNSPLHAQPAYARTSHFISSHLNPLITTFTPSLPHRSPRFSSTSLSSPAPFHLQPLTHRFTSPPFRACAVSPTASRFKLLLSLPFATLWFPAANAAEYECDV